MPLAFGRPAVESHDENVDAILDAAVTLTIDAWQNSADDARERELVAGEEDAVDTSDDDKAQIGGDDGEQQDCRADDGAVVVRCLDFGGVRRS